MYTIKMGDSKELITTVRTSIHQGEKYADTLAFLLPNQYENVMLTDCTVTLRYVLPLTADYSERTLECSAYNDDFLICTTDIDANFTDVPGTIQVWLVVRDADDHIILETGRTSLQITETTVYDPDEDDPDWEHVETRLQWIDF